MTNTEKPKAIANLTAHKAAADRIAASITEAATHARAHGASWTEIGTALGISKQAAAQRFGKTSTAAAPVPATTKVDAAPAPAKAQAEQTETESCTVCGQTWTMNQHTWRKVSDEITRHYDTHKTPKSSPKKAAAAEPVFSDGIVLDRAGHPIDLTTPLDQRPNRCKYCGSTNHNIEPSPVFPQGHWFYFGCQPTQTDQLRTTTTKEQTA